MPSNKRKSLTSLIGVTAATVVTAILIQFEGVSFVGYIDPIGIPTKCMGDTYEVEVGKVYSDLECIESLQNQIYKHAAPILQCVPQLQGKTYFLVPSISFSYNFGVAAYCSSSIAKAFRAGQDATACVRFNEKPDGSPQWVFVKDTPVRDAEGHVIGWTFRTLPGLVKRRAAERALCEIGLIPQF